MKQEELEALSHDILLMLYDRTAKYSSGKWSFESAFRALGVEAMGTQKDDVLDLLVGRGWIVAEKRSVARDTPVELTDRGRMAAINVLESREPQRPLDRLHAINWATWGGLAAVVAAIASVAAAIFAYMALR